MSNAPDTFDLFICYSRRDLESVERVVAALEARGCRCWMDKHGIAGSDAWRHSIALALNSSRAVLFFASEASYQSRHVGKELSLAEEHHLRIIPLRLDGAATPPGQFQLLLAGIHYIDFAGRNPREAVDQILGSLAAIAPQEEAGTAPVLGPGFHRPQKPKNIALRGVAMLCVAVGIAAAAAWMLSDRWTGENGAPATTPVAPVVHMIPQAGAEPQPEASALLPEEVRTHAVEARDEAPEQTVPSEQPETEVAGGEIIQPEPPPTPTVVPESAAVDQRQEPVEPKPAANPTQPSPASPGKVQPALDGPIEFRPPGS